MSYIGSGCLDPTNCFLNRDRVRYVPFCLAAADYQTILDFTRVVLSPALDSTRRKTFKFDLTENIMCFLP